MRNKVLMTTLLLITLIATACAPTAAPAVQPAQPKEQPVSGTTTLDGTSWSLTTLNGQPALKDTTVTLNFAAGKVAGSDGCNNYNGSYTADDTNIKFNQPMAATMKACLDPIMKQADTYQQALGQAATYKADARQLTLYDASGKGLAVFDAQSNDLAGTSWIVISYNNGKQAVVSVAAGTELTANFGTDGKLSGSAGCNNYTASYTTDGNKISIGPAATTQKACEQAVMDQEQQYLAALAAAATYRIDGNKLELRTADGALVANFTKAPAGSDALPGSAWIVVGYNNGKGGVVSTMAGTDLTANFGTDGVLSGNSGCNTYTASYTIEGDQISIGPAASTRKACEQAVMDQEQQYLAALSTAATYRIDGSKLELRTADGALAVSLTKATAGGQVLSVSSWIVTGYNNGKGGVVSTMAETKLTANFGADGMVTGSGGCNDYSAAYKIDGKQISIGPAVSTKKACEQAVMDQEQQYLTALSTAATYRIDGSKMELRTAEGATAANFMKATK